MILHGDTVLGSEQKPLFGKHHFLIYIVIKAVGRKKPDNARLTAIKDRMKTRYKNTDGFSKQATFDLLFARKERVNVPDSYKLEASLYLWK